MPHKTLGRFLLPHHAGALGPMTCWLCLVLPDHARQYAGNAGYDDEPLTGYVFDSTVSNGRHLRAGDLLLLTDGTKLVCGGRIARIDRQPGTKPRFRCPSCRSTALKNRKTVVPDFRCSACRHEFTAPVTELIEVDHMTAVFESTWGIRGRTPSHDHMRRLCQQPASYHSIRRLNNSAIVDLIGHGTRFVVTQAH